jgi:hypothetical protein
MTKTAGRRSAAFGALGLFIAVMLSGCSAPAQIAVRVVDGDLLFSVCQRTSANRIEVSMVPDGGSEDDIVTIWSATGSTGTHERVTFSSRQLPGQSVLDAEPRRFDLAGQQLFLHYDVDRNGEAQSGLFASWDGDEISDEYWLDADGDHHVEWCADQ